MAGAQNHGTIATARITQGLSTLKVIPELLKRFGIQLLDAKPVILRPLRYAVCAPNEAKDTRGLIPTLFEPENESIEMGTGGTRTVSFSGERPF
jgi:hypothetical protein